jgi:RimJ/RimL family protein N-acetyltransferase
MDFEEARRRKYRIPLETPRLQLRPFILEDAVWLAPLYSDPDANRFLQDRETGPEQAKQLAEAVVSLDLMRGCFGHWAILDKATGEIHGWTELGKLRPWHGPSDEIALSYVLSPGSWGRGIATEAAGRLLRHAFETIGLEKVMAVIFAENAASRRVLEKLGMRPVESPDFSETNLRFFEIESQG